MTTAPLDEAKLKDLFKSALIEVLEERKDLIRELIEEAIEDVGLVRAIEEGEHSGRADERELWQLLSHNGLEQAYGDDEVEYSLDLIKEPNPDYEAR
jgi:hypothetical protein